MKLDFTKNRVFFLAICIFLATVLVLLAVWKQGSTGVLEGMIIMDFTTPSNPANGSILTDMDLQGFNSALIPFEKKFETADKAKTAIDNYTQGFVYDPSGNTTAGEINVEGISSSGLDSFIKHLNTTSKAFQQFADALTKMKKDKMNEAIQKQQGLSVLSV